MSGDGYSTFSGFDSVIEQTEDEFRREAEPVAKLKLAELLINQLKKKVALMSTKTGQVG
jgi:hypothetical protein